jgi:MFS family permease
MHETIVLTVIFYHKYSLQIIREFCNATVADHYGINMGTSQLNILWSIIVSIYLVGGVTGSLSGGWVADRFGR